MSELPDVLRFTIRVKPRARSNRVGGSWGEARALLVEVQAPAVDNKANRAVQKVLASALSVKPSQVAVLFGAASRSKVVEVTRPPAGTSERLRALIEGDGSAGGGGAHPGKPN